METRTDSILDGNRMEGGECREMGNEDRVRVHYRDFVATMLIIQVPQ
jgi:hypothetical protein